MAERLKSRPELLDRRREVVEHPFGSIATNGCEAGPAPKRNRHGLSF